MKIVKPLRLGLLHRPFRWRQQDCLAFTVLAHVSLADKPVLLHDNLAWTLHGEEPHVDALFDQFMPKPVPEFLVSGYAYTRHHPPRFTGHAITAPAGANVCAVSARLGDKEKRLTIHGDRYWVDGRPTFAAPFEQMPLGRGLAFGGPDYPENPGGRGHGAELVNGIKVQRLPNIESDVEPIHSPRQVPAHPAGMGMLDPAAPSQTNRLGSIDAHYLERDHPGLPHQIDWQYFNVAPLDQRWTGVDHLPPAMPYLLRHLHPHRPVQQGTLPDAHARCFVVRRQSGATESELHLEEIGLRLTTVWFFPHRDSAVLLYHGSTTVADNRASDITHAMPAYESSGKERSLAHFEHVLALRCDKKKGLQHLFRESDLISEELIGPGFDTKDLDNTPTGPREENQQRYVDALKAQRDQELRAAGRSPAEFDSHPAVRELPPLRRLADLPEYEAEIEKIGAELEATMAAERERLLEELRGLPPTASTRQMIAQLTDPSPPALDLASISEQIKTMWKSRPESSASTTSPEQIISNLKRNYLSVASFSGAAASMDGLRAAVARRSVQEQYARDRNLSGWDLTGANLSGLDLRGANLRGSFLESVDLTDTLLDGADLTEALLVRTRLVNTSLRDCRCDGANLSKSSARRACFAGLKARDVMWFELDWEDCDLSGAHIGKAMLQQSVLNRCRFEHAVLEELSLMECTARELRCTQARIVDGAWFKTVLSNSVFDHALWKECVGAQVDLSGSSFVQAKLDSCVVLQESSLNDAVFDGATIDACFFRGTPIARGQFSQAVMFDTDFSDCLMEGANLVKATARECLFASSNLRAAVMRDANLIGASFEGADLRACDLGGAVLFGAELGRIITDASTIFDDVLAERANVYPRAKEVA